MRPFNSPDRQLVSKPQWMVLLILLVMLPQLAWSGNGSRNTQADILATALPVTAYALTGLKKDKEGAWAATKSLGLTVAGTLALNTLVHKDTPTHDDNDAFPSGHSSVSFSSAAFMQRRYGWRTGLPAYAVAGYVGWLRVKADQHDWTDVIGGAALGIGSSMLFTKPWTEKVALAPWIGPNGAGIEIFASW